MNVDRTQRLAGPDIARLREGVSGKQRCAVWRSVFRFLVDLEFVLPFQREKNPLPGRMKIQVAALKIEASSRSDRQPVRQHSILVVEYLQRTWIFRLAGRGTIPPRDENDPVIRWVHPHLMSVDAYIQCARGFNWRADGPILLDPVHGYSAGSVIGR